jgi:cobaltochelatase CobS
MGNPKRINDNDGKGDKVQCLECETEGKERYWHRLDVHLDKIHGISVADYRAKHPGAPTISQYAYGKAVAKPDASMVGGGVATSPEHGGTADPKPPVPDNGDKRGNQFVFASGVKLTPRTDLDEYDKKFIPTFDPDWQIGQRETDKLEAMAVALADGENIMDVGPTGCGKTASVHQLAAALNQPCRKLPLSGDTRVADFFGTMVVEVDEDTGQSVTRWQDGTFTDAVRRGHWVLLDELDACPPAILFGLHSILEQGGKLVIAKTGEVIEPHPQFRVFATANTLGRGDDSGLYAGTNILNEAFLDRFGVVLHSDYPDAPTEVTILVNKTGIPRDRATKMVEVARRTREAAQNEEVFCTFSTRRLLAWCSKTIRLRNIQLAAEVTILNKLSKDDRDVVSGLIQRHVGSAR